MHALYSMLNKRSSRAAAGKHPRPDHQDIPSVACAGTTKSHPNSNVCVKMLFRRTRAPKHEATFDCAPAPASTARMTTESKPATQPKTFADRFFKHKAAADVDENAQNKHWSQNILKIVGEPSSCKIHGFNWVRRHCHKNSPIPVIEEEESVISQLPAGISCISGDDAEHWSYRSLQEIDQILVSHHSNTSSAGSVQPIDETPDEVQHHQITPPPTDPDLECCVAKSTNACSDVNCGDDEEEAALNEEHKHLEPSIISTTTEVEVAGIDQQQQMASVPTRDCDSEGMMENNTENLEHQCKLSEVVLQEDEECSSSSTSSKLEDSTPKDESRDSADPKDRDDSPAAYGDPLDLTPGAWDLAAALAVDEKRAYNELLARYEMRIATGSYKSARSSKAKKALASNSPFDLTPGAYDFELVAALDRHRARDELLLRGAMLLKVIPCPSRDEAALSSQASSVTNTSDDATSEDTGSEVASETPPTSTSPSVIDSEPSAKPVADLVSESAHKVASGTYRDCSFGSFTCPRDPASSKTFAEATKDFNNWMKTIPAELRIPLKREAEEEVSAPAQAEASTTAQQEVSAYAQQEGSAPMLAEVSTAAQQEAKISAQAQEELSTPTQETFAVTAKTLIIPKWEALLLQASQGKRVHWSDWALSYIRCKPDPGCLLLAEHMVARNISYKSMCSHVAPSKTQKYENQWLKTVPKELRIPLPLTNAAPPTQQSPAHAHGVPTRQAISQHAQVVKDRKIRVRR